MSRSFCSPLLHATVTLGRANKRKLDCVVCLLVMTMLQSRPHNKTTHTTHTRTHEGTPDRVNSDSGPIGGWTGNPGSRGVHGGLPVIMTEKPPGKKKGGQLVFCQLFGVRETKEVLRAAAKRPNCLTRQAAMAWHSTG